MSSKDLVGVVVVLTVFQPAAAGAESRPPPVLDVMAPSARLRIPQEETKPSGTGQEPSPKMDRMAESMTAMAETCQAMMQREKEMLPLKIAAACIVGALLAAALVLFIVLEVQSIRWLGLRIRNERSKVPVP